MIILILPCAGKPLTGCAYNSLFAIDVIDLGPYFSFDCMNFMSNICRTKTSHVYMLSIQLRSCNFLPSNPKAINKWLYFGTCWRFSSIHV